MKLIILFSIFWSLNVLAAPQPLPTDLPTAVRAKVEENGKRFLSLEDCSFLVQSYDKKDPLKTDIAFCIYTRTKTQGIYKNSVCLGALVEPISLVKNPYYGSKGNWGMDGACDSKGLSSKLSDTTDKRMTPTKSFGMQRKEGMNLRMLRDDLGLWDTFNSLTNTSKK